MITRIGQLALVFKNPAAAIPFYRDTLGLTFLFSASADLSFFDCGGTMLMFTRAERPEFDHPNNVRYLNVPEIHAAHAALAEKCVRFEEAPKRIAPLPAYDLWMAFFRGPREQPARASL